MKVFFYGLFMDRDLLAGKGIVATEMIAGCVDGYRLRIGQRATLVQHPSSRAYGVMMELASDQVAELYSEDSVADYLPELVVVKSADGSRTDATCYNLPADLISGSNAEYASALLELATRLGLPESYLDEIRRAGRQ